MKMSPFKIAISLIFVNYPLSITLIFINNLLFISLTFSIFST